MKILFPISLVACVAVAVGVAMTVSAEDERPDRPEAEHPVAERDRRGPPHDPHHRRPEGRRPGHEHGPPHHHIHHRPPHRPEHPRLHHLEMAERHLREAGLERLADEVGEHAERLRREIRDRHREGEGGLPALREQIYDLRREVAKLRDLVEDLREDRNEGGDEESDDEDETAMEE